MVPTILGNLDALVREIGSRRRSFRETEFAQHLFVGNALASRQ